MSPILSHNVTYSIGTHQNRQCHPFYYTESPDMLILIDIDNYIGSITPRHLQYSIDTIYSVTQCHPFYWYQSTLKVSPILWLNGIYTWHTQHVIYISTQPSTNSMSHLHITNSTSHLNLVADKPVITHPTRHLHINSTITNSMSHRRESLSHLQMTLTQCNTLQHSATRYSYDILSTYHLQYSINTIYSITQCHLFWEVGGWGRDPKKCTGRDWGMGSSTI